jgi:hypothetical protein
LRPRNESTRVTIAWYEERSLDLSVLIMTPEAHGSWPDTGGNTLSYRQLFPVS